MSNEQIAISNEQLTMSKEKIAMNKEQGEKRNNLYSLIPIDEFKALLGVDDRDDKLTKFCLVTSTLSIEEYCRRKLLSKIIHQVFKEWWDLTLFLSEYPVREIIAVSVSGNGEWGVGSVKNPHPCGFLTSEFASQTPPKALVTPPSMAGEILEPEFYSLEPLDEMDNIPYLINLSPAINRMRGIDAIKVIYKAGYFYDDVPKDLSAACLELAAWNMSRYKGRRVGMTGNVRGNGKEGEHFEMSMPENVKALLEPYRRKVI